MTDRERTEVTWAIAAVSAAFGALGFILGAIWTVITWTGS